MGVQVWQGTEDDEDSADDKLEEQEDVGGDVEGVVFSIRPSFVPVQTAIKAVRFGDSTQTVILGIVGWRVDTDELVESFSAA